jgi:hypothetical protein
MKKQSLRIFLMFGLLAILAISSAHAQTAREMTAKIGFSFTIGDKTFPSGEYRVTRLNPASDKAALMIKSADSRMSRIVLTVPVQSGRTQESAKLVFNRYGEQYFLAQVWTPADNMGLELSRSRAERSLARNIGQPEPKRTTVALNLSRK